MLYKTLWRSAIWECAEFMGPGSRVWGHQLFFVNSMQGYTLFSPLAVCGVRHYLDYQKNRVWPTRYMCINLDPGAMYLSLSAPDYVSASEKREIFCPELTDMCITSWRHKVVLFTFKNVIPPNRFLKSLVLRALFSTFSWNHFKWNDKNITTLVSTCDIIVITRWRHLHLKTSYLPIDFWNQLSFGHFSQLLVGITINEMIRTSLPWCLPVTSLWSQGEETYF